MYLPALDGGTALLLSALWYAAILGQLFMSGWLFVEGTVKTLLPLTLAPQWYLAVTILPRLKSMQASGGEPPAQEALRAAAHPSVPLSFSAAALASGISAFSTVFAQPVLPGLLEIALRFMLVVLLLLVPAIFARRRYAKVVRGSIFSAGLS
ncbi:hypothetical protein LJK88_07650 [Paenibacillus sp. P26]|nr:hypothetical protein LJK88_07650 [Paenibacillus sp. P26]UUZ90178.1 hypothetical protein LJK87_29915 [Paenibacillus sp. P25]